MHGSAWLWFSALTLLSWGVLGIFQKKATNLISAEAAMVWSVIGFMLLQPLVYGGKSPLEYPWRALAWAMSNGVFNGLGAWMLMLAMRAGGKASVVTPIAALYPLVVVLLSPVILHESITRLQAVGVACGLISVLLLSIETEGERASEMVREPSVTARVGKF
jgi:uncharacterized membrane protein